MESQAYGGLVDCSFKTRCPPLVTPETIVIAVCGPNDYQQTAAPENDGWFFSDFYLFYHLLRGTAKQQQWLTCVPPKELVRKYKEYAHGDPKSDDRRIVLSENMLKELDDVLIFPPADLLERFLAHVAGATKQTRSTDGPILVLLFGHGIEDKYSVIVGGYGKPESCPVLTQPKFKEAILRHNPDPNIALLTTACYGSGWVQTNFFNITGMAGVDESIESLSWSKSASLQRCCGSKYATSVAQALIKQEIQELDLLSDEGIEVLSSPTYASLVNKIYHTLAKEIDPLGGDTISFSAKDDLWDSEWRVRSGFPLTSYKDKWLALQTIPRSEATESCRSGSVKLSDTVGLSTPDAEYRLKRLAYDYMHSYPGPDEAAKNHRVHNDSSKLLEGKNLDKDDLDMLAEALRYRMNKIMARATEFKDRLGIVAEDCRNVDVTSYDRAVRKNTDKWNRWNHIYHMVIPSRLFDTPVGNEGHRYEKGNKYLVMIFTETNWTFDRIKAALEELAKLKGKQAYNTVHL